MNEQQAKWLLDETFNSEFDINRFLNFVKELINNSNLYVQDKTQYVPTVFKDYIVKVEKLGQYKDKAGKSMELLAIKLAKHSSLERARTMQRNFIAKWLEQYDFDGAIVAFYDDEKDWRFSFVKLEYNLVKDEKDNTKTKKVFTPAKRYSYLVGPNEPNHTCKKQFVELLSSEHDPLFEKIENSFGIEKVTKEFFEEYKKRFLELKESLEKVVNNDSIVKEEFLRINNNDVDLLPSFIVEFSKKLLGQLVFLYFLQKKGWLGVGTYDNWGTGPKDFMRRLLGGGSKKYTPLVKYDNFFNDILEPLFYDTLARKRDGDYCKFNNISFKIPFLNGGLFEPLNDYRWEATDILLDNRIFHDIFTTFDTFNFTIKEDEPLEKEVAVDPEMLGKVFENLLEIIDRKSKGAFYTPREIVHYMCQQSLINYLETNSIIPRVDIEKFIQEGDKYLDQTIRAQIQIKKWGKTYDVKLEYIIPKSIEENYEKIDELLKNIKVVDPAVGSGAFPVGMMNEIVKARSILDVFIGQRETSELKRECIENSLYGVDIMPSAVDICQLRFWLSLVVDELDRKKIKPLPNLDNKIMCGNSLLEEFEGVKLFDDSLLEEEVRDIRPELDRIEKEIKELNLKAGEIILGKSKGSIDDIKKAIKKLEREKIRLTSKPETKDTNLTLTNFDKVTRDEAKIKLKKLKAKQKDFFNSFDRDTKKQLKQEIEKIEWELIEATLKQQGNEEAIKKLNSIMKSKSKPFFLWKLYFAEVFQRENPGFDVVIANPPYVFTRGSDFSKDFKDYFKKNFKTGVGKLNLFSLFIEHGTNLLSTNGFLTYIIPNTLFRATPYKPLRQLLVESFDIKMIVDLNECIFEGVTASTTIIGVKNSKTKDNNLKIILSLKELLSNNTHNLLPQDQFNNSEYVFAINFDNKSNIIFEKLKNNTIQLGELCKDIINGIVTPKGKDDYISDKKISEKYKPFLEGKDIDSYVIRNKRTQYILFDRKILHRARPDYVWEAPEKLIIRRIGGGLKTLYVAYDNNNFYTFASTNNILIKEGSWANIKYILSLLNSKLINWFFIEKFTNRSNLTVNITKVYLEKIPIKQIHPEQQKPFIQLVDQILSITKDEDYLKNPDKQAKVKKLEKEIDKLVYQLYELTPEEINIVEEFNEK